MDPSILNTTKKLLGIAPDYTHYDQDVIIGINSALMSLMQLGVGPTTGFVIKSASEVWEDLIDTRTDLEMVKAFIYLKTRLLFDPPQSGFLITAIKEQISELEWRLNVQIENTDDV